MNLDDYLKNVGELADALAEADGAAEKAATLDKAIATADMYDSDEWIDWALELVPLAKNPSGPNGRRPKTRIRFHKASMIWAEQNGHQAYSRSKTEQNIAAGQAARYIPKTDRSVFETERQVRPLTQLMKAGLQARIPEAVEIATKGGIITPTGAQVLDAVKEIKHKARAGGGTRYTPLADEVTSNAEYKAEEAFRKLVKAARKSANGAEQVNKYIQFIKDERGRSAVDDLDDLDLINEVPPEEEYPRSPTLCGMGVAGERTGHCDGAACGYPGEGCCRNFYGIKSWDKHYVMDRVKNIKTCHPDAVLVEMGYLHDGPHNSWRLASVAVIEGSKEEAE